MNAPTTITRIDATANPLNDLEFLEETLEGKDWHASIAYPDATPASQKSLREAQRAFESRGYITRQRTDKNGQLLLELHHLGEGSSPTDILNELGAGQGTLKLLTHPGVPLGVAIHGVGNAVHWLDVSIHDPARANGVVNLFAESILFFSGLGNGKSAPEAATPLKTLMIKKNFLHTLSYVPFIAQSAVYAFIAKNNDDTALERLHTKINRTIRQQQDVMQLKFDPTTDKEKDTSWNKFRHFMRHYPVQIGGVLDDLGMGIFMMHAYASRKWEMSIINGTHPTIAGTPERIAEAKKYVGDPANGRFKNFLFSGFANDVRSAITSILAWSLMVVPRKERTSAIIEKDRDNPFAQTWDRFRENPQIVSGVMTMASSSQRIAGGISKGNPFQTLGETMYLGGDIALLLTKSDEYGGEKTKNIDALADKIADYINEMPRLFGPDAQHTFAANIAEYLKEKSLEEIGADAQKKLHLNMNEINERTAHLTRAIVKKAQGGNRLDKLAYRTVELINLFPEQERPAIRAQLVASLLQLPWLEASAPELNALIAKSPNSKIATAEVKSAIPDSHTISKRVADILDLMPGIDTGGSAIAIRKAIAPFIGTDSVAPIATAQPTTPSASISGSKARFDTVQPERGAAQTAGFMPHCSI